MIRYVYIGNQLYSDMEQFTFYNTINDSFIDMDDKQVFDSVDHFKECYSPSCGIPIERFINLIPKKEG